MLAFAHIHKTAGTTLIYILRREFFLRHLDVRTLSAESNGVFSAADLRVWLRLNPFPISISGHSVKIYSDLESVVPDTRYITVLRDPVSQYISLFFYVRDIRPHWPDIETHLKKPTFKNRQMKELCGADDLDYAIELLERKASLVGVQDEFDEFLLLLKRKLQPLEFNPLYVPQKVTASQNPRRKEEKQHLLEKYRDDILENNEKDLKLLQHIQDNILPKQRDEYGPALKGDVERFKQDLKNQQPPLLKNYIDYALRKSYYFPLTGCIRKVHGLPFSKQI